jgi:hypothetical protein
LVKQNKEGHFILTKGAIHQKKMIVVYAPNVSAPNFKLILKDLKAHTDSNTVVVGDFNTSLSPITGHLDKKSMKKS